MSRSTHFLHSSCDDASVSAGSEPPTSPTCSAAAQGKARMFGMASVLPSAVADGEVMLLCMGNEGTMRMAANLILSLRAMGLHHMLAMAPERGTCDALWITMPTLACVWWPSQFARKRPSSLYNDMFSRTSLAFFEALAQHYGFPFSMKRGRDHVM